MRRGTQQEVPSPGQNRKVAAFGAINYATGKHRAHVPNVPQGGKNATQFLVFFETILSQAHHTGRPIVLVIDQGGIHKAKKVEAVLSDHKVRRHVHIFWLPKYSPRLNEQEHVWKVAKERGVANVLFTDREALRAHVERLLVEVNSGPEAAIRIGLGGHHRMPSIQQKLGKAA